MGKLKSKLKKIEYRLALLLCICILSFPVFLSTTEVFADDGWVDHYSDIYDEDVEEETAEIPDITIKGSEQSTVGKYITDFIKVDIADNLNTFLESLDMNIDSVILGRLSYSKSSKDVSYYRFEFSDNNPYGLMGAIVYAIIASYSFLALIIQGGFAIFKSGTKNSPQARAELKSEVGNTLIFFIMVVLMPFVYDLSIYIRDVFLVGVRSGIGKVVPEIKSVSLYGSFSKAYESNSSFILACLMVGVAYVSIKFGYNYVMIALTMTLHFISFAFLCVYPAGKRKIMFQDWISRAFSCLIVPFVDYILFMLVCLVPVVTQQSAASCVIQLFIAWSIIPARKMLMSFFGGNSSATDGIGGMLGLKMAADALKKGADQVRGAGEKISKAREDNARAKEEEEMASSDENQGDNLQDVFDNEISGNSPDDSTQEQDREENEDNNGDNITDNSDGVDNTNDNHDDNEMGEGINSDTDSPREADNNLEDENNKLEDENEQLDLDNQNLRDANNDINNELRENDKKIGDNEKDIEKLQAENERLADDFQKAQSSGDVDKANDIQSKINRNNDRISSKNAQNESLRQQNGELRNARSRNNSQMAANSAAIRRNNNAIRNNDDSLRMSQRAQDDYLRRAGLQNYNPATATPEMKKAHELALKRANVNNFDSPQMQGLLSHQEMADFYKQRRNQGYASAVGMGLGAVAGGVLGGAFASWEGPAITAMGIGYGSGMGSAIGSMTTGATYRGFNRVSDYFNSGRYAEDVQRHARAMAEMGETLGLPSNYYERENCGYAPIDDVDVEDVVRQQEMSMPQRNVSGEDATRQNNYSSGDWHDAERQREEYAAQMNENYRQLYEDISSHNAEIRKELDDKYKKD